MVKHIILFKLRERNADECVKIRDLLLSMKGKVDMIEEISVGVDFLGSERSYDIALEVTLADRAALEAYQNDKYHCDVVKSYIRSSGVTSVAVDYEF